MKISQFEFEPNLRTKGTAMLFYRGIAVPADAATSTTAAIRQNGLQVRETGWRMGAQDLKSQTDRLGSPPKIERSDVNLVPRDETEPRVCACADQMSALF
jgi:hypothetical protein